MKKSIEKLVCFADETGQDTNGRFFLVATCVIDSNREETLEKVLSEIEIKSNKKFKKWTDCTNTGRRKFLDLFTKSSFPTSSLAYSEYKNSFEYAHLISLSLAQAINRKISTNQNYSVKIFFDRINKKIESQIKVELRKLKIKYKKVRGMKDESFALIRLTDSMAGFIRDFKENAPYTIRFKRLVNSIRSL